MKIKTVVSIMGLFAAMMVFAEDTESAYIQSDGTQVIDLGFPFTEDMTIGLLIQPLVPSAEMTAAAGIVGARSGASDNNISAFFGDYNGEGYRCQLDFNNGSYDSYRLAALYDTNDVHQLVLSANYRQVQIPGMEQVNKSVWTGKITTPSNAQLFGVGGTTWSHAKIRFYEMWVVQNGVTTHHFVPAEENGVVGVRDEKDSTIGFRTSEIGNPLVSGSQESDSDARSVTEPRVMGVGIRELDYIESDGTQYIDTELAMNSTMSVSIDFTLQEIPQSITGIFGVRNGVSDNNISFFMGNEPPTVSLDYTPSSRVTASAYALGMMVHRSVLHMTPSRRTLTLDDGTVICDVETENWASWRTQRSAHIFKVNAEDNFVQNYVKMRLYRLRIVDANDVLRDYVPCMDANGKVGLYDSVTDKIVYSQAGGNGFAYGAVISTVADESQIRAHTTVTARQTKSLPMTVCADFTAEVNAGQADAYVESDRTQFIDLGFKLSSDMVIDLDFMPLCNDWTGSYHRGGIFGARTAATDRNIEVIHHDGTLSLDLNYNTTQDYRTSYQGFPTNRYLAHIENGNVYLRDFATGQNRVSSKVKASQPFETVQNAHLFDSSAGDSWTYGKIRFYKLMITRNGKLVHYFIPAMDGEGHIGVRDAVPVADGGCGFCYPTNSGANLLKFIPGKCSFVNNHTVSAEVCLTEAGEPQILKAQPLKPGIYYRYAIEATSAGTSVASSTGVIATLLETFGEGAPLAVALPEEAPKPGKLEVRLARDADKVAEALAVTAYFGTLYGDTDPAKWEQTVAAGTFAAGEQCCSVTLSLPKDTVYVRFKTAEDGWSPTVFIPETQFTPFTSGLMIIVR